MRGAAFLRDAVVLDAEVLDPEVVLEVAGREETADFLVAASAFFFAGVVPWAPARATASAPRTAQNRILRMVYNSLTGERMLWLARLGDFSAFFE